MQSLARFQQTYDAMVALDRGRLKASDLQLMVRWGRLIHTVRLPLLFTKLRDKLFVLAGSSYICTVEPTIALNQSADAAAAIEVAPTPTEPLAPTPLPTPVRPPSAAPAVPAAAGAGPGAVVAPAVGGGPGLLSPGPSSEAVTLQWYRNLLDSFVRDYVAYLRSIELTDIFTATGKGGAFFVTSATDRVETPRVFLIRVRPFDF